MKKLSGLLVLIGQVQVYSIKDCSLTDPTTVTLIFSQTKSSNHFKATWQALHFSYCSEQKE
jgi:hypothetical protein